MNNVHAELLATIVKEQTGRDLVWTEGGLYVFSESEIRVPFGVEGTVHELCHWVVASESERKQLNLGLINDWQHPNYNRMVRCEELAWSLEFYLFGDIPVSDMILLMTPESRVSGGGSYASTYYSSTPAARVVPLEEAAKAEIERAKPMIEQGEELRREALLKAERVGLRVKDLKKIIQATIDDELLIPDMERELCESLKYSHEQIDAKRKAMADAKADAERANEALVKTERELAEAEAYIKSGEGRTSLVTIDLLRSIKTN